MRILKRLAVGCLLLLLLTPPAAAVGHCPAPPPPAETFVAGDAPYDVWIGENLSTPWGYDKPENATREYPLVVIGCWNEGGQFTESVRQEYPAFYLTYIHCSSDADGENLADLIDTEIIADEYRIDTHRIYLTGFSMGGSGSYKLVRGFLNRGKLFSGLIRIAGGSESVLPDEAVESTSIWYSIGLLDTASRVQVARDAYAFVRDHALNTSAVESTVTDTVTSGGTDYARTTKTLTKDGIEIMKLSEYPEMGHTSGPPYADPAIFDWFFLQSICHGLFSDGFESGDTSAWSD